MKAELEKLQELLQGLRGAIGKEHPMDLRQRMDAVDAAFEAAVAGGTTGMQIKCGMCGRTLTEPGALYFGPPSKIDGSVRKVHMCVRCCGGESRTECLSGAPELSARERGIEHETKGGDDGKDKA